MTTAPLPDPTEHPGFYEGTLAGELRVERCASCGTDRFPPRPGCHRCGSPDRTWAPVSGRGTIWSYAVVHAPVLAAFDDVVPYPVVVVALDDGEELRMVGSVVTGPEAAIDSVPLGQLKIGEPVEVCFVEVAPGLRIPRWVHATSEPNHEPKGSVS